MSEKVYGIYPNKSLVEVKSKTDTENMIMETAEIVIDPVTKAQYKKRVLTKAQYDALHVKDSGTEYVIIDEEIRADVADKLNVVEIGRQTDLGAGDAYVNFDHMSNPITTAGLYAVVFKKPDSDILISVMLSVIDLTKRTIADFYGDGKNGLSEHGSVIYYKDEQDAIGQRIWIHPAIESYKMISCKLITAY